MIVPHTLAPHSLFFLGESFLIRVCGTMFFGGVQCVICGYNVRMKQKSTAKSDDFGSKLSNASNVAQPLLRFDNIDTLLRGFMSASPR